MGAIGTAMPYSVRTHLRNVATAQLMADAVNMLQNTVKKTDEARFDYPTRTEHYIGIAPLGSAASAPVWNIIRLDMGPATTAAFPLALLRVRSRDLGTWDGRTAGWGA